ncbi:MAG: hypothetical protein CL454_00900 [Acidimicrobiaceae bacterium]|nr:hypothetical protein [Acidimicrobiaceae bacterium]|tara:strand:- start:2164 stop:2577 length:414 start_codon:yes stop_codon:yes gene_type:complete
MSQIPTTTLVGGDHNEDCWSGGNAVVDDFRKQYRRRAQDMDSFGLAIQRVVNHVNALQDTVEKLAKKHKDIEAPEKKCKVCLPSEYAGASASAKTRKVLEDGLIAEAMRTEIIPRLPYDSVCNLTTVPAELANASWN